MNLGSRLEEIIEERGITVTQLARMAEVSPQTLYAMIRRDSNKVDMNIMARLLMALEMDLVEFMQLEKSEPALQRKKIAKKKPVEKTEMSEGEKEPERKREMETYLL